MVSGKPERGASKILVVTFVSLSVDAGGPAKLAIGIARALHRENRLQGVVSPHIALEVLNLPAARVHSPPHPLFQRLLGRLLAMSPGMTEAKRRRIRESLFDFFLSRSSLLRDADAILFLKPTFPQSASRATALGVPSFVWASILSPDFNRDQVITERQKWNIDGGQAYTDGRRIETLKQFFARVGHILVGSRLAHRSYSESDMPAGKISLIEGNFAVDLESFSPSPRKATDSTFRVIHVSQMNIIKGIGYLLSAWSKANLDSAELVLVGSMEPEIAELCRRMEVPSLRTEGFAQDVSAQLSQADVFVSPSVADLHPYTVLEAMACGVPVIVSDQCGISSAVDHGQNGFVYPYADTDKLATHLRWCRENPEELAIMGNAAREKALQYTMENFSNSLLCEIDRING
ncbi:MAG: glycosyltransferase family 4 protein [Myxococcota bacterium]|nr:glycosyltransferase family 4 protein [Myxococcota bacterium]